MKKRVLLVSLVSVATFLAACAGNGTGDTVSSTPIDPVAGSSVSVPTESSTGGRHGNSSTTPVVSSSSQVEVQPLAGTDVFYLAGFSSGSETASAAAKDGKIQYWSGDGGTIHDVTKKGEKGFQVEYTNIEEPNQENGWGWYGCQIFYTLPYAVAGDTYTFRSNIKTDIAGDITINGEVITLAKGENLVTKTWTRGAEGGADTATLAIQLGKNSGGYTTLQGSIISFNDIEIHDETNTYFETKFLNGTEVLKDIQVRSGAKVTAPEITIPEDKLLDGWYDGETKFDSAAAVTASHNYSVRFINKSEASTFDVTLKLGEKTLETKTVLQGAAPDLTNVAAPFGYAIVGWYTDASLTTAYEGAAINEATTLFAKAQINPVTWINSQDAGWCFHDEISHDADGAFVLQYKGWGSDASWHNQVNFEHVPAGEEGKNYVLTFAYSINVVGGSFQIYDGASYGAGALDVTEGYATKTIEFPGGTLNDSAKLTFELGAIALNADIVFKIGSLSIAEKVA